MAASISAPDAPSIVAWCIFVSWAMRPPSTPSITYSSHSGRDRSSGRATMRATTSASCSAVAGRRHGVVAHVEVEVEGRVLHPVRQVESEWHVDEAAGQRARRSMRSAMSCFVASRPAPPGAPAGS